MTALPQLDGVHFRIFGGPPTTNTSHASSRRRRTARDDDRVETPEGARLELRPSRPLRPGDGPPRRGGRRRPVGYSRVWWDDEADGPRVYRQVCFLDPALGGRGIGWRCFAWNEARLREIAAREHDVSEKVVEAWANDRNERCDELIRDAGFEPVTLHGRDGQAVGRRPPRPSAPGRARGPACPRGGHPRDLGGGCEAFRDHWGYVEPTEAGYERFRAFPYLDPTLWKVAWDDEGVAGQVKSFIDTAQNEEHGRKRGWTEAISTCPPLAPPRRREGTHRRVDPRARRPRDDRGRARRAHGEPERRLRPLRRASATRSSGPGRPTASRSEREVRARAGSTIEG